MKPCVQKFLSVFSPFSDKLLRGDIMEQMHLCLSDMLDQDLTSYEYYHSLPEDIQRRIQDSDVRSFDEMQSFVAQIKQEKDNNVYNE